MVGFDSEEEGYFITSSPLTDKKTWMAIHDLIIAPSNRMMTDILMQNIEVKLNAFTAMRE